MPNPLSHPPHSSVVVQWTSGSSTSQSVEWWPTTPLPSRPSRSLQASDLDPAHQMHAGGSDSQTAPQQAAGDTEAHPHGGGSAASKTTTYAAADMCGAPATTFGWLDPGYQHLAVIPDALLTPNTRYSYRFGSRVGGLHGCGSACQPYLTGVALRLLMTECCQLLQATCRLQ